MDTFLITCEHGGNGIPAAYETCFSGWRELLESHRGYDPGALAMARDLAEAFGADLVASTTSRLLVDLNRSIGHPHLFSEATADADPDIRTEIVAKWYRPHRQRVEHLVAEAVGKGHRVVHIASHSFTPVLDGMVRTADVGFLYDPTRRGETELCARWKRCLLSLLPELRVRRNYPYLGRSDGLTTHLRRQHGADAYVGVELEVNQSCTTGFERRWASLRSVLVQSLRDATRP